MAADGRASGRALADVLHVLHSFFPETTGGTEVYVRTLIEALRTNGVSGVVAVPGSGDTYEHLGIPVFSFATGKRAGLDHAYFAPDEHAARSFRALIERIRPRVVHLHSYTAEISDRVVDAARDAGARTLLTYHVAGVSCRRGTLLYMGESACDGRLDVRRCTHCTLVARGLPRPVAGVIAAIPPAAARLFGDAGLARGALAHLRVPALIAGQHARFQSFAYKLDLIVAPCAWAADLLRHNGVPADKILLCPMGTVRRSVTPVAQGDLVRPPDEPLKLAYFGRLHPTKGADMLTDALRRVPDAAVTLDIYGLRQGPETYAALIASAAVGDERVRLLPAIDPDAVIETMSRYHLIAIPSRCVETGPLVVLEAFASGTPVLGADLGGIAELVTHDIDGVLVGGSDPTLWAGAIAALARDPERVARLRAGVHPPRTMVEVAREMSVLYDRLFKLHAD
jgi:glycosyltransferase involved in cell wall biosynthesis